MELNRRYKLNQKVYIFGNFENGVPHVYEGTIKGVVLGYGIYEFIYQVETAATTFFRFPDAIFLSVKEMQTELQNLLVE